LLGNVKNGDPDYRLKDDPRRVNVHDLEDKQLDKVAPYGVYDVNANSGFVSVGITSGAVEFAHTSEAGWNAWDDSAVRRGLQRPGPPGSA
jgi:hypothetical protein